MREIKFRAWDFEDKKMWKVVALSDSIWGDCEEAHIRVCDFDKYPVDKETDVRLSVKFDLMQYTGLKDKNGREIYEGDITDLGVIFHINGCFMVGVEDDINKSHVLPYGVYKGFSVIGNIYENPELLEGVAV